MSNSSVDNRLLYEQWSKGNGKSGQSKGPDITSKWSELLLLNAPQASRISINSFPKVRIYNVCLLQQLISSDPPKRLTTGKLQRKNLRS